MFVPGIFTYCLFGLDVAAASSQMASELLLRLSHSPLTIKSGDFMPAGS